MPPQAEWELARRRWPDGPAAGGLAWWGSWCVVGAEGSGVGGEWGSRSRYVLRMMEHSLLCVVWWFKREGVGVLLVGGDEL